eukprot:Platyproteum_vivax@DN1353_c0_g1_i1.p1
MSAEGPSVASSYKRCIIDFAPTITRLSQNLDLLHKLQNINGGHFNHKVSHRSLLPIFVTPNSPGCGVCTRFCLLVMPPPNSRSAVLSLAWRPDGTLLSAGSLYGDLVFWNYHYSSSDSHSSPCFSSVKTVRAEDYGLSVQKWANLNSLLAIGTDKGTLLLWKSDEKNFYYPIGKAEA